MPPRSLQSGISAIRAIFADATDDLSEAAYVPVDPNLPRDGILPGEWPGAPFDRLPPNCPVQVLGHEGGTTYCVSATGQLFELTKADWPQLTHLFAPQLNEALWAWPGWTKAKTDSDGKIVEAKRVNRLERDKCFAALVQEGARKGFFDVTRNVRGRGGWRMGDDSFCWHSGESLWRVDSKGKLQRTRPTNLEGKLYPSAPDVMTPWREPVALTDSPAHRLADYLKTWSWERPWLDPVLAIGWVASGFLGGALHWRPPIYLTGGQGVGKSTLQRMIRAVFGSAVLSTEDTTAAGIYQVVKHDCLPVMIDELEASRRKLAKAISIIELARIAASGGQFNRGGADHVGTTFTARNCFALSGIIPPPMGPQDKARIAMLNMDALDRKVGLLAEPVIRESDGRMILRQMMDGWRDLQDRILPDWKRILHGAGFDARQMDTFGTLLACAETVLGPEKLEEMGIPVSEAARTGEMIASATMGERLENIGHWERAIGLILDTVIHTYTSNQKQTVGQALEELEKGSLDLVYARERLATLGLGLRDKGDPGDSYCLCVPTTAEPTSPLAKLFADTDLAEGGWTAALRQAPKGVVLRHGDGRTAPRVLNIKINRRTTYCQVIDLAAFDRFCEERAGR